MPQLGNCRFRSPAHLADDHLCHAIPGDGAHRLAAYRRGDRGATRPDRRRSRSSRGNSSKKTEEAIAAYEQALAQSRAEAHAIAQETRDKLAGQLETERVKLDAEMAKRTEVAEARIAQARDVALSQVNDIASDAATNIVSSLIGSKLTKPEVSAAVAKALAE